MGALSDLSADIAAITDRVGKSVVSVEARHGRPATGTVWEAGFVLTADHVIEDDANILVGDRSLKATIAGRDAGSDLALLSVDQLQAPAAPRNRRDAVRPGEIVLAIGHAGEQQVTLGVVSGFSDRFRSWRGGDSQALIQTTAELLPGFSGGPLVDADGQVIGINSWHFGRGVSRALPAGVVEAVVRSLRSHGRIRRPYLGVGAQPVRLPEPIAAQLGQETGMLVVTAEAGGPAAAAGVLQGDTIVRLDDQPVRQLEELFGSLRGLEVGSKHRLRVVRAGQVTELDVTLGERQS